MYDVGDRIKQIRLQKGLTMEEFGKMFHTSKGTVNNWEKGRNKPNKENLKAISELGNISVDTLLYGKPIWSEMDNKYNKDGRLAKEAQEVRKTQDELSAIDVLDIGNMLDYLINQLDVNNSYLRFEGADLDDELREVLKNSLSNIYETAKLLNKK